MIFIIHDYEGTGNLPNGFRAVEGFKPIKLPESIGLTSVTNIADMDRVIANGTETDATTFSVVFSPAGRLVLHDVRVSSVGAGDDMFNTATAVSNGDAMFYQDVIGTLPGLGQESSVNRFTVFDRKAFRQANSYSGFWEPVDMNPYTGTMIFQD